MKNLLITIDYRDSTNKYWQDSSIKNKIVKFNPDIETIHQLIYKLCDEDLILTYKGKPQGNVHIDTKEGNSKLIGYMYRGKGKIDDKSVYFDVWVTIYEVIDFPIEDIER